MTEQHYSLLQDEFSKTFETYERQLQRYSASKVSNQDLATDLVQDAFLKTWRYLVRGGRIETMKSFLYHVLNHLIIDEYRRSKTASLDSLLEKGFEPIDDESTRMADVLDGKANALLLRELPEKYRVILDMRYMQGLTIGEMAKSSNQSKNTTAVQIHRGLRKLRTMSLSRGLLQ